MPARSDYAPGVPSWVDIGTDLEPAKAFYTALFGWETMDAGPVEETGGYGFFMKDGNHIAGYGPQMNPGPPFWASYVAVADADETTQRVIAAGGAVIVEPMDIPGAGRMAVFQDPQGAVISAWQAGQHQGAQLVNEPGAFCWNELNARDVGVAKAFYPAVFDWGVLSHDDSPMPYTEFQVGGDSIAGMLPMPPMVPAEVPSYWLVYFAVEDSDASAARVEELGGSVQVAGMDSPAGRFSVVTDPQGATFAVITIAAH